MNERISELIEQVVTRFNQDMDGSMEPEESGEWVRFECLEELMSEYTKIVAKKCMDLCYDVDWEYGGEDVHATWCAQEIGKYFGIK